MNHDQANTSLDRAEKLVRDLPKEDGRKERLTKEIADLKKLSRATDPWGPVGFPDLFDAFDDAFDDDD